jgi:hypothetical protein
MQMKFKFTLLFLRQIVLEKGAYNQFLVKSVMKHVSWLQTGSAYPLIIFEGTFTLVLHQTSVPSPAAYDSSKNP